MQPVLISYSYALNTQVGPLHEYVVIVAYIKYKSDRIIAEFILRIGWKLNDCRNKVGAGGEMEWKSGWCNVGREEVVWSDLLSKNQMLFVILYREREDKREKWLPVNFGLCCCFVAMVLHFLMQTWEWKWRQKPHKVVCDQIFLFHWILSYICPSAVEGCWGIVVALLGRRSRAGNVDTNEAT